MKNDFGVLQKVLADDEDLLPSPHWTAVEGLLQDLRQPCGLGCRQDTGTWFINLWLCGRPTQHTDHGTGTLFTGIRLVSCISSVASQYEHERNVQAKTVSIWWSNRHHRLTRRHENIRYPDHSVKALCGAHPVTEHLSERECPRVCGTTHLSKWAITSKYPMCRTLVV